MKSAPKMKASLRVQSNNPNHHLWWNNGTWFIHYTVHLPDYTKERERKSLQTKEIKIARWRRDLWLNGLAG